MDHVKATVSSGLIGASYGLAAGSAAGYIATALKITKTINFMNLGLAVAVGLGTNAIIQYVFRQSESIQKATLLRDLIHQFAIHVISILAAIYVTSYASLTVYTFAAVAAGVFLLFNWLQPSVLVIPPRTI